MSIELKSDRYIRDMVAHLPGVTGAVYSNAKTIKIEAEQRLAMHSVPPTNSHHPCQLTRCACERAD